MFLAKFPLSNQITYATQEGNQATVVVTASAMHSRWPPGDTTLSGYIVVRRLPGVTSVEGQAGPRVVLLHMFVELVLGGCLVHS